MSRHPVPEVGPARRGRTWRARAAGIALVATVVVASGACGSDGESGQFRAGPAFHSAGPKAFRELEAVLQSQADLIAAGDWPEYFELYVPSERQRCSPEVFGIFAEQVWSQLREQSKGQALAARVVDVKLNGFRAAVDYQLVVRGSDLATQQSTDSYLKLGDRWFIEEQAC